MVEAFTKIGYIIKEWNNYKKKKKEKKNELNGNVFKQVARYLEVTLTKQVPTRTIYLSYQLIEGY